MKKQKVSLKKLNLIKSKVAKLSSNTIVGGGSYFCATDNGCGPKSVWPDICPASHNCPPATATCQTINCNSLVCESVVCESAICNNTVGCPTGGNQTTAC